MRHALRSPILAAAASVLVCSGAPAGAYRETAVVDGGRIVGTVSVTGTLVPLPRRPVVKEREFCGADVPDERLVVDAAGRLAGAVVRVEGVEAGKPVPRDRPVRIDNRKCAFVPHVAAATVGQTLELHNEDPFLHDAHAFLGTETLFNLAIPKGRTVRRLLDRPGVAHVNCNVRHTWMHAYLFVADDPYHAVTGADGRFVIEDVPPGVYTVSVWHELLGSRRSEATVEPDGTTTRDFAYRALAPEDL